MGRGVCGVCVGGGWVGGAGVCVCLPLRWAGCVPMMCACLCRYVEVCPSCSCVCVCVCVCACVCVCLVCAGMCHVSVGRFGVLKGVGVRLPRNRPWLHCTLRSVWAVH